MASWIRRTAGLVLLVITVVSIQPIPVFAQVFPDVDTIWYRYREAIEYLVDENVISGYPDGTYRPDDTINRAELIKIVFKGRSDVQPIQRRCFTDVNPDEWYAPYVCAAKQRGIVSGYRNGSFQPGEPVNIAEALKIILNAYSRDVAEATGEYWYKPYVDELDRLQVLPENSYLPWEPLTRKRAADILWRVLRYEEERVIPALSPGCGRAPRPAPTTVDVRGEARPFLLTVPERYSYNDPAPLLIAYHGRTNSNSMVRSYYRFDREFTDAIIAYPAGLDNGGGAFTWQSSSDVSGEIWATAVFDALVKHLSEHYCINMDQIYVAGHSLGAWAANSVACQRGDIVKASASLGGDGYSNNCTGPVAGMVIHNPNDRLSPFAGSERIYRDRIALNQCEPEPESGPGQLNCERYRCVGDNDILWCPHTIDTDYQGQYYPHNWPGGTAALMVNFFRSL